MYEKFLMNRKLPGDSNRRSSAVKELLDCQNHSLVKVWAPETWLEASYSDHF
jgi:hypothetical protein